MDVHDVMTFVSVLGEGGVKVTLIHSITGIRVSDVGVDKERLKDELLIKLKVAVEVRNVKIKIPV